MRAGMRWLLAAPLCLAAAAPAAAQNTPAPGSSNAYPSGSAQAANAPAAPAARPPAKPAESGSAPASNPWELLLAAGVSAVVAGGVAFGVARLAGGRRGPASSSSGTSGDGEAWGDFEYFRADVMEVMKAIRGKASNLDSVPRLTLSDWSKQIARARADLERAPLSRADHEPLRQLWVDVTKICQDTSERAGKSAHGKELAESLYTFTQALSRRMQEAAKSETPGGGSGDASAIKKELRLLQEQVERGSGGLAEELKRLRERVNALEQAPPPTLGSLVEDEFRVLCESRADELSRQLAGMQRSAGAAQPVPPVVKKALAVADAAMRVSEEALRARNLDPGVKAQLTNLATLAGTLQAMCPVAADQSKPPSVDGIRGLPDRPEAKWQPEMVARGGSVINAVTAYWSEVNRLLQAETARVEQWLGGAAPPPGAQEAAIAEWLGTRLLPLLDQADSALAEDGPARREARQGSARDLLAALDELHRACHGLIQGTGLEARMAQVGQVQHPEAGVKIDHADGGRPLDTVLEVRQVGWSWQGRLLRELHVVVQEEPHARPGPVVTSAAIPGEGAGPRAEDAGPRVKRL